MRILAVADEESRYYYTHYQPGRLKEFDLILACGDLSRAYLEFLVTMAGCPLLSVHGNHDERFDMEPPEGCVCFDGRIHVVNGVRILGLGGSYRYKKGKHMYIATRHLLEMGHTRIAFLMGQRTSSSSMMRYDGYLQMMRNYQIPVVEEYQLAGDLSMEKGFTVAREAFARWQVPPTAIVVSNDLTAFGFLAYCNQAGIRVPEDISVVSFDNVSLSAALTPPLTTVDAHVTDMGKQAAEMMIERIENPDIPTRRVILKPELVERKSVKRIV